MSAEELKTCIQSANAMWLYYYGMDGSDRAAIEVMRLNIIALMEQERKAAVDEYIAANKTVGACQSIAEKQRDKRQLIIELTKAALNGGHKDQDAIKLAIYLADEIDKLDL